MKKLVIILLIVLPFVLIYFISITGQVLEKYSHIYVESISLEDGERNQIEQNVTVEIEKDSVKIFNIIVAPALASNPAVEISNINPEVCEYELIGSTLQVRGLKYGQTKIIITSIDRRKINYTLSIKVTDDIPTGLVFNYSQINIMPNKEMQLAAPTFIPSTTKYEYRGLIWESSDESIVKIIDNSSGLIKSASEGTALITARSIFDSSLYATITIVVGYDKSSIDVHFDYYSSNPLKINEQNLDLKNMIVFSDSFKEKYQEEERYNQFGYRVLANSQYVDISNLSEGLISFIEMGKIVTIGIYLNDNPDNIIDEIKIVFIN